MIYERAFLQMDMSGNGALDDKCLSLIDTGAFVLLRRSFHGRPLFAYDPSRINNPLHDFPTFDDARLQIAFYFLSIAAENPAAQSLGVVTLTHLTTSPRPDIHRHAMRMIRECTPFRTMEFHVMILPSVSQFGRFTESIIDVYQLLLEPFTSSLRVYRGATDQEVLQKLADKGFPIDALPDWMGGEWSTDDYQDWRKRRLETEIFRGMSKAQKKARRREADASRARMRRMARRQEVGELQRRVWELESANAKLEGEYQHLQSLLFQSQAILEAKARASSRF